jgi:hypothetical protein
MFRKWCTSEGFMNSRNLSHVLMDGGCLSVPSDKLSSFNEQYVRACLRNEKVFVVETCDNSGKVTQGVYLPVFIYDENKKMTAIDPTPTRELLDMATVRTDTLTVVKVEPPAKSIKEGCFTKIQTKNEVDDIELQAHLEMFIQKNMEGQGGAKVTKIFKHKNTFLVSTTSRYCENLGREHGSNHVWFYIGGNIISQKCFCRCETIRERRHGFCRDFIGKRYILTPHIMKLLCPDGVVLCRPVTPKPLASEEVVATGEFETFIQRYFPGHSETKVIKIQKNKIFTNSNYCEDVGKSHGQMCFTVDKKGLMTLGCPCKNKKSFKVLPSMFKKITN